jgi:START domain
LKTQRFLILSLALLHSVLILNAQEDWKLKTDKEGIKIYTKPYANSKIKALKVLCTLEATVSQMAAVLLDIKSQDEWFYRTKSTVLLQVSTSELYYYAELEFPFPFSNRDFVEHIKLSQNPVTKIMTMEVQNVPNYIPPKQDLVRVINSYCKWVITPVRKNLIMIEFILFADPAGSIPGWLINMFSHYGPLETFKKLKIQIKKPEFLNMNFAYIKD